MSTRSKVGLHFLTKLNSPDTSSSGEIENSMRTLKRRKVQLPIKEDLERMMLKIYASIIQQCSFLTLGMINNVPSLSCSTSSLGSMYSESDY